MHREKQLSPTHEPVKWKSADEVLHLAAADAQADRKVAQRHLG